MPIQNGSSSSWWSCQVALIGGQRKPLCVVPVVLSTAIDFQPMGSARALQLVLWQFRHERRLTNTCRQRWRRRLDVQAMLELA